MFKGRPFAQSVILLCVRWYLAYSLSLRDLEEMMAERGIAVDHTIIHHWTVRFAPLLLERFNRRKRSVTGQMAYRRDLHQGPRPVDVSLPRHRQRRRHSRILVQRAT
jgi:transposase-like protein